MYKRILQLFALVLICFAASVCLESDAFAADAAASRSTISTGGVSVDPYQSFSTTSPCAMPMETPSRPTRPEKFTSGPPTKATAFLTDSTSSSSPSAAMSICTRPAARVC